MRIEYKLLTAMGVAIIATLSCIYLVLSGIGSWISSFGQDKIPVWDNWFVNSLVWLGEYAIPFDGMPYVILTVTVLSISVVADINARILGDHFMRTHNGQDGASIIEE